MSTKDEFGLGLCLLVSFYLATSRSCQIQRVRVCKDFFMLQMVDFPAYIPTETLDSSCQRLQNALSCIYVTGRLNECQPSVSAPFSTQGGVITAMCGERKEEYLRSDQCFNTEGVKTRIARECFSVLTNSTMLYYNPCRTFAWVADCAHAKIVMTDRCGEEDAALMRDLVEIYLRPSWDIFKCHKAGKMTNGAAAKNKVRDEAHRSTTHKTVQRISTSQEPPRPEENTHMSSHTELTSNQVVAITKQETPSPNLQTIPMRMSDEDDDESQLFLERYTSEVQDQTRSDKDWSTESPSSFQHPRKHQLNHTPSSSSSRSIESIYPAESGPGAANTTINQSGLDSSMKSPSYNYNITTSSTFPPIAHESQVEKKTLRHQLAIGLGSSVTRLNTNGVSARVLMSTQGSSGSLGVYGPLQISLLILNGVLLL